MKSIWHHAVTGPLVHSHKLTGNLNLVHFKCGFVTDKLQARILISDAEAEHLQPNIILSKQFVPLQVLFTAMPVVPAGLRY